MYDLVISGGTVADGTGAPAFAADVGVIDGRIVAVAPSLAGQATETIAANGCIVTPGFVDVHTHYDGQATWDEVLEPSASHGVTTVVMGNCGVGFAPVAPGREEWLIQLMEGVEDIPGAALSEGMAWGWEHFGEYLDVLSSRRWSMDVATQIPHGAVRGYVMGDRGGRNEPATRDDIDQMANIVQAALESGAFGFTTSRTMGHLALDGQPVPGTFAAEDELLGIAAAVRRAGGGVFEVAPTGIAGSLDDPAVRDAELDWMARVAETTGDTVTMIVLQVNDVPDLWRAQMEGAAQQRERGNDIRCLIAGRPFGLLFGWDARNPFAHRPSCAELAGLDPAERRAALTDPARRARILAEDDGAISGMEAVFHPALSAAMVHSSVLGDPPDYEPTGERRLTAVARERGGTVAETAYDLFNGQDGNAMLILPLFNYTYGDHEVLREQLEMPGAVLGLDDGGAHCGTICDASIPTYMLTHWVRDRERGPRLGLETVVAKQTSETAELYGLTDRGVIAEGRRADLNVINLDELTLHAPYGAHDLPGNGRRLLQRASGYRATVVAGTITRRNDTDTGERPGRLLRRS